jgi:N-methylhydantoinase A/oxoprolinase/acetone carboxylase beta subunit
MAWQIGVDVGGTFTDLLAFDPERRVFRLTRRWREMDSNLRFRADKPSAPR